jgi:biopolymer transport protein ExbB/TolQ
MADLVVSLAQYWWQLVVVLISAYLAYRFDKRAKRRESREERVAAAIEQANENKRVLQGEEASIDSGIVEIVELHDEELDNHDKRLQEAEEERAEIINRLEGLKRRSEQRCDHDST